MSLSSLLLGKSAPIDAELDTLFKAPVAKPPVAGPSKESATKKRKLDQEADVATEESTLKRSKGSKESKSTETKAATPKKADAVKSAKAEKKQKKESESKKASTPSKADRKAEKKTKGKGKEVAVESDEDDEELENAYLAGRGAAAPAASQEGEDNEDGSDKEDEDDDGAAAPNLVHESVEKKTKKVRAAKTKFVPQDETPEQRDLRTIFVGNLPLETASKKPLQKQLKNHILSSVPTAKIESIRFRSIPFQVPTAKLPEEDDDKSASKKPTGPRKEAREHVKERTSAWRSKQDEQDDENLTKDEKRFLNPAQKKKIAYINQEFHTTAGTVNAYIVFAHPPNTENRPANLPPLPPTMDPYQAARGAAEKCDGTFYLERMLRVDMVVKDKTVAGGRSADAGAEGDEAAKSALLETDPRLSIFVGNLDFASKEEDLRVFFEGVVSAERGAPSAAQTEATDDAVGSSAKPAAWVTRVRIVRDKDTQLGKGFAYVQFADRECVDEVLALEETKLKFAKRKLRVQRCKTAPGAKNAPNVNDKRQPSKAARPVVIVPKGDPRLGEKLHGLPKEERKQLKSADADRVARRLAKKKARMAMAPGVGKEKGKGKGKPSGKGAGKERKRVRS